MYLAVQGSSELPATVSFRIGVQLDTDYGKTHAHHILAGCQIMDPATMMGFFYFVPGIKQVQH